MLDITDLSNLTFHTKVSADDIARLSGQNRIKGIHPFNHKDFTGVVILCTIGGKSYPNEWLDTERMKLKYYLEGKTNKRTGKKTYNPNINTNRSIVQSKGRYPIVVFTRDRAGQPFIFDGNFEYSRIVTERSGDLYFELIKTEVEDDFFHISSMTLLPDMQLKVSGY